MRKLFLVVSAVLLAAPAFAQRLPGGVTPEHYTLWFAPDLARATFRGRETIRVQVAKPTTAITLHAAEITFGEVSITAGGRFGSFSPAFTVITTFAAASHASG